MLNVADGVDQARRLLGVVGQVQGKPDCLRGELGRQVEGSVFPQDLDHTAQVLLASILRKPKQEVYAVDGKSVLCRQHSRSSFPIQLYLYSIVCLSICKTWIKDR